MAPSRDLSVLLVEAHAARLGRPIDVADALAGAGARTLRIANECDADVVVHANDGDPAAVRALAAGRAANGIPPDHIRARHGGAHAFLATRRFDVVDIDPFGSAAPFLDAAVRATRHGGYVCVTATDTAALCGAHPRACRRRYAAEPLHAAAWRAEAGLRILMAAVVRAGGRLDRGVEPGLAVFGGHWMRAVMRVQDGKGAADRAASMLGFVSEDPATGLAVRPSKAPGGRPDADDAAAQTVDDGIAGAGDARTEAPRAHDPPFPGVAGPLWLGPLHDAALVAALRDRAAAHTLGDPRATMRLLGLLVAEADAPPFWLPLPGLPRRFGLRHEPRRDALAAALRAAGFHAAPTHLDAQGLRTDAPADALRGLLAGPADS